MEVIDARSALLSNFEVLALLRDLDADHIPHTKHALPSHIADNLRTVELEAIQHLSADYQPTSRQSDPAITQLVRDLAPFSLTNSEKLQIVNLAPTEPVELYVIVEELEDRLGDSMDEILHIVQKSLSASALQPTHSEQVEIYEAEQHWEHDAEDVVFDDLGEGAGLEGDLDIEDD